MKKLFSLLFIASLFLISCSDDDGNNPDKPEYVILDISDFDLSDGIVVMDENGEPSETERYWKNTFNTGDVNVTSQIFKFSHSATDWGGAFSWYGFTVSNVTDNSNHIGHQGWINSQWGCMAKGGEGAEGTPFIIAYAPEIYGMNGSSYDGGFKESLYTNWIKIDNSPANKYKAIGVYICNHPWTYYTIQDGDTPARKFEKGDYLKLKAYGVKADNTITDPVELYMADYRSEDEAKWTMSKRWEWMDLRSLGEVQYVFFTMETTDVGQYGANTPLYFCLDRFTVEMVK